MRGRRLGTWTAALVLAVIAVGLVTPRAWAWWTDSAAGTGSLTARTITAPTLSCAGFSVGTLSTSFSWTAVPGATSYTFSYQNTSKTVTGTTTSVPTLLTASTAWVVANVNYGQTTWSSVNSNTRSYWRAGAVGSCS